jgi:hypothetical protein
MPTMATLDHAEVSSVVDIVRMPDINVYWAQIRCGCPATLYPVHQFSQSNSRHRKSVERNF